MWVLLSEQRRTEFFSHGEFRIHHTLAGVFLLKMTIFSWFLEFMKSIFLKSGVYFSSHAIEHTKSWPSGGSAVDIDHRLARHGLGEDIKSIFLHFFWFLLIFDGVGFKGAGWRGKHKAFLGFIVGGWIEYGGRTNLTGFRGVEVGIGHHLRFIDQYNYK